MCREVPESRGAQGKPRVGESAMVKVLNEILLYSVMAAFVTGIVVLAAATWITKTRHQIWGCSGPPQPPIRKRATPLLALRRGSHASLGILWRRGSSHSPPRWRR